MSAFVVSREHIDALVSVAVSGPEGLTVRPLYWPRPFHYYASAAGETLQDWQDARREVRLGDSADTLGRMLWGTNATAVRHRYPDLCEEGATYPGPVGFTPDEPSEYEYRHPAQRPTAVEALKLLDCYEYQTSEHRAWRETEAFHFCDALRGALIRALPGYADAPWEWSDAAVMA